MTQKPMRVGVVGAGMISEIYLKNMIHRFDGLEVVAVCSARMDSARRRAAQFGIEARTFEFGHIYSSVRDDGKYPCWILCFDYRG